MACVYSPGTRGSGGGIAGYDGMGGGGGGRGWRMARDRLQQETNFANGAPRRLAPLDYIICGI